MIASLSMYMRPELEAAHGRYWDLIRHFLSESGVDSPKTLSQTDDVFSVWNAPDLVLSQTCGLPYRTKLHDHVTLIGTPDFGVEDCKAGYYRSAMIVHKDNMQGHFHDYRSAVFAYNEVGSQSGYAAPYWHVRAKGYWFKELLKTGSHIESARAVASGKAGMAGIDAVTWRLIQRYDDFADQLRVFEWTVETPSLPYIAAKTAPQKETFEAVRLAILALEPADRAALGLKGIIYIPLDKYREIRNP